MNTSLEDRWKSFEKRRAEANRRNKAMVFAALAKAGIRALRLSETLELINQPDSLAAPRSVSDVEGQGLRQRDVAAISTAESPPRTAPRCLN